MKTIRKKEMKNSFSGLFQSRQSRRKISELADWQLKFIPTEAQREGNLFKKGTECDTCGTVVNGLTYV